MKILRFFQSIWKVIKEKLIWRKYGKSYIGQKKPSFKLLFKKKDKDPSQWKPAPTELELYTSGKNFWSYWFIELLAFLFLVYVIWTNYIK